MSGFFGFCAATREPRELPLPPYIVSHLNSMIDITVEWSGRSSVTAITDAARSFQMESQMFEATFRGFRRYSFRIHAVLSHLNRGIP